MGHSKAIRKEAGISCSSYQLMVFTQSYSSAMCREALASSKTCLVEDMPPSLYSALKDWPKGRWAVLSSDGLEVNTAQIWGTTGFQSRRDCVLFVTSKQFPCPAVCLVSIKSRHLPMKCFGKPRVQLGFHYQYVTHKNYTWQHSAMQYLSPFLELCVFWIYHEIPTLPRKREHEGGCC